MRAFDQFGTGSCINCGLLGKRMVRLQSLFSDVELGFYHMPAVERASGKLSPTTSAPSDLFRFAIPSCYAGKADFADELFPGDEQRTTADLQKITAKQIFDRMADPARKCRYWMEWIEFRTPAEHYEDWRMMELEKMRQEQTAALHGIEVKVLEEQTKIAAEHAKTAAALNAVSERASNQTSTFNRFFLILAVATLLLTLATFAYPNGLRWAVDHAPGAAHQVLPTTPQSTPSTAGSQP